MLEIMGGRIFSVCEAPHVIDPNMQVLTKALHFATVSRTECMRGGFFFGGGGGGVSEGLDDCAQMIVGIPFPNFFSNESLSCQVVELKRKYKDTNKSSKNLGGSEWYCQQAYHALNQAAGRCIRHRFDYGAIIFLGSYKTSISIETLCFQFSYDSFEEIVDIKILESHEQNLSPENQSNEDPEKETSGVSAASPCSSSKNESSSLATGLRSLRSPDRFLKRHLSTANFRRPPPLSILEAESPLNMSVNSHALKRRKFHTSPVIIDLEEESSNATNTTILDPRITRRIEFGVPNTCLGVQVMATVSSNVQFMSKILFFADHPSRSHE
ncbi:unnamed protein product [Arabidopsis halleri]